MPGISYGDGGISRAISAISYQDGGSTRTLVEVWYGDAGNNRKVWPATTSAQISDQTISDAGASGTRVAGYRLNTSGIAERRQFVTYSTLETWRLSGVSSDFEARVTVLSGALTSGTINTWVSLGSSQEWNVQDSTPDSVPTTAQILVEIRTVVGGVVQDSATINLSADRQ